MTASLPMYPVDPAAVTALWQRLRTCTPTVSLPETLLWPDPLLPHWLQDDLSLSQTCGYPLMATLVNVQVVGAFHYAAPGCEGACYRSWIVVREEESGEQWRDFQGRKLAYNSEDSQSGYRGLIKMTGGPDVFSQRIASGGHRRSLALLREKVADIAAIDCVSWALLRKRFPAELQGLKVIGETASVPSLPLITGAATSAQELAALRAGLMELTSAPAHRDVLAPLLITHFSVLPRSAWQVIVA